MNPQHVLITGGLGFLGKHIRNELMASGNHQKVTAIDHAEGDLCEPGVARDLIARYAPDTVVHLAAQVGRLFGEADVEHTIRTNALMTTLVAQACADVGARLLYASTSEVYGDIGSDVASDGEGVGGFPGVPHNLYGLSKRWGEETARLYAPKGLVLMRFSMPYGPGLPAGRGRAAIINMLDQAQRGERMPVHEGAERSWCWVGDTARAVRLLIESPPLDQPVAYNVGRDDAAVSMLTVAQMACDLTGGSQDLIDLVPAPENQTVVKRLSTSKLRQLGWKPEVGLPVGMANTLASMTRGTVPNDRFVAAQETYWAGAPDKILSS